MTRRPVRDCPHPRARHEHGTRQAYTQDRCRCLPCRLAAHHANRAYRTVGSWTDGYFPSAVGVQRRIEALHAAGWASTALAARLGVTRQAVRSLQQRQAGSHALASTHAAVAALYDELWDQAPTGRYVDRTRRWAAACGFVAALAWDDDEIDQPDATPHQPADTGWNLKPCGTVAAARRHYRVGEPLCAACRAAQRRRQDAA